LRYNSTHFLKRRYKPS